MTASTTIWRRVATESCYSGRSFGSIGISSTVARHIASKTASNRPACCLAIDYDKRLVRIRLDVTDDAATTAAVATAVERFGRLDVLVNTAGYANVAPIEDVDFADFQAQLDANLLGVVRLTRAALPVMRAQRSGRIIQISSVGGQLATPGLAAYQAAKWAVGGFSSVLAAEVAPLGIKVTVLEPGGMRIDWAGTSMRIAPIRPEYEPTVGRMAAMHGDGSATTSSSTRPRSPDCRWRWWRWPSLRCAS